MADMKKYGEYYKTGTASSTGKMLDKFKAKANEAVEKLQDPATQTAWHTNVSKQETKERYAKSLDNLSASDLTKPMEEKGIDAYRKATSAPSAVAKWETNAAPYVEVAQEVSRNKKPVTSTEDAIDNVRMLIEKMKQKKAQVG